MTTTVDPAAKPKARFVVMYDTPSDVDAFERHSDLLRGLPRHDPAARRGLIGQANSMVDRAGGRRHALAVTAAFHAASR